MDTPAALPPHVKALLDAGAYPHRSGPVRLIQTHISWVLLAGRFAYKLKKPVALGFLDYTSLAERRRMCEEEVRLNRRLCPRVYLGVVPVTAGGAAYRMAGGGAAIDYAVKMRRVPRRSMMPEMLERGLVTDAHLRSLARTIADFHREAATDARIAAFGRVPAVRRNWDENFAQVRPYIGHTIAAAAFDAIASHVARFLREQGALIELRADAGRVRDVHGDLRADSVVYGSGDAPCVMDCIEFSERLRCGDVASDVAFLAMDLERRGHRALADAFLSCYLERSPDETLPAVLTFSMCYRAFVRGKVHSIEAADPGVPDPQRQAAAETARACFRLAVDYAGRARRPALVLMCGLTGSGKSYFANALAGRLGSVVLSSDVVRKELLGVDVRTPVAAGYGQGAYTEEQRRAVYAALRERAEPHLGAGRGVVLDATHAARSERDAGRALAARHGVPAVVVWLTTGEETVRDRLEARALSGDAISGGRWETYLAQRRRFEPPAADERAVAVTPSAALDRDLDRVVVAVGALTEPARSQ
ncbi:MAG: AAA family ATPase [Chloroflexota bacterium]|nr:AAA family ATPase [Chloroflexota bacterium]